MRDDKKIYCPHCDGDGVIQQGNSFFTCPQCIAASEFMMRVEIAIAEFVLDEKEDEAFELHTIYELLQNCPVLAVLEARHLEMPKKFVDEIIKVFDVKRLE